MSGADYNARKAARKAVTCRHFNGIQSSACDAGIDYGRVPRPLPCLPRFDDGTVPGGCPQYAVRTPAELAADAAELEAIFAKMRLRSERGECLHCGAPVFRERQVGRCIYADPCGHRQGQGAARRVGGGK